MPPSDPGSAFPAEVELQDHGSGRWHRTVSSSVSHKWPRIRLIAFSSLFVAFVACCSLLVTFGYPRWRTVAFACVFLTGYGLYVLSRVGSFLPRWPDDDFSLAFYFMASVVTGGIHSPIVVAGLGPLTRLVQTGGANRPTAIRIAASAIARRASA